MFMTSQVPNIYRIIKIINNKSIAGVPKLGKICKDSLKGVSLEIKKSLPMGELMFARTRGFESHSRRSFINYYDSPDARKTIHDKVM